jgi:hypothetical protein
VIERFAPVFRVQLVGLLAKRPTFLCFKALVEAAEVFQALALVSLTSGVTTSIVPLVERHKVI